MAAPQKTWSPRVSARQTYAINLRKRYKLLHGPKMSGKTRGVQHAVAKHMWEENAVVGIFAKSIKSAAISGSYSELIKIVLPEWFAGPLDFHYTVAPKVDGATRTHTFSTSNVHGTESTCHLWSIDNESEIDVKTKNLSFSMIWVIELSNFEEKNIFLALINQLRHPGVSSDKRQWIADTNPAEEGEDNWIYKMFVDPQILDPIKQKPMLDEIGAISFSIDDNPYLPDVERQLLEASYAADADLNARFILGQWVRDKSRGIFADRFDVDIHVIGSVRGARENWEVIVPSDGCTELLTGWDPGDVFHSFHLLEKIFDPERNWSNYVVIDEFYTDDEQVSIAQYAQICWQKMTMWAKYVKTNFKRDVLFRNWSDSSAQYNYSAAADSTDANIIARETGNQVRLMAAPKGAGSVGRRVVLGKRLLADNRLLVSANCTGTIEMFKFLKKPKTGNKAVQKDKYGHRFDSLTYPLDSEEPIDVIVRTGSRTQELGLISVSSGW